MRHTLAGMTVGRLFALYSVHILLKRADAITPGGKRAPPNPIPLNPVGIYGSMDRALQCMQLVRQSAAETLNYADTLPNCLRAAYHDSSERNSTSPGGANGSWMNEMDDPGNNPGNLGTDICHSYLKPLVYQLRRNVTGPCAKLTFADAIQWVAGVAVELTGGPAVPLLPGREDCDCFDDATIIADECTPAAAIADFWSTHALCIAQSTVAHDALNSAGFGGQWPVCINGLCPMTMRTPKIRNEGEAGMSDPVKAAVALSGAHALGSIRSTVAHDASNGAGFGGQGPVCIGDPGPMTATPNIFDNHYFVELYYQTGRAGYLFSDRNLAAPNASTLHLVQEYVASNDSFFSDWVTQFQEMSLLGVDTKPAGFSVTSGFLPGGPVKKVLPMTPQDNVGFTGTDALTFTHPERLSPLPTGGGQQSIFVAG